MKLKIDKVRKCGFQEKIENHPLKATDYAYIAGIIDGEGSIQVYKHEKGTSWFDLEVGVSNNDKQICEYLKQKIGGCLFAVKATKSHNLSFRWCCKCQMAKRLLEKLIPFLIAKKNQAILAVDFQNKKTEHLTNGGRFLRSTEQKEYEEWVFMRLKEMKKENYIHETKFN